MSADQVMVLTGIFWFLAFVLVVAVIRLIKICGPNEVLIFSGFRRQGGPGVVGYQAIKGGRRIKVPLFEVVDKLDLTNMAINVSVEGAFSRGGIPLNVDGVANVKIGGDHPLLHNAVHRLLGKPRAAIIQIAKETLEGNLRGVLATMTPEEVNSDKITFAKQLIEEADQDLHKLGLELDTLKIQNVSDERGYLDSIGRISGAEIRKHAVIAEAENQALSAIRDASNVREAQLVSIDAQIRTAEAETAREVADAETKKAALVAESQGEVKAAVAEARAQLAVEHARIAQVQQLLEADVVAPARARLDAAVNEARGAAAKIIEDGRASAEVLNRISAAWKKAGDNARDVFLMQKLQSLVETLTKTVENVRVDKITVLGGMSSNADASKGLAPAVIHGNEQLKAALGVDLVSALQSRLAAPAAPAAGSRASNDATS